MRRSWFGVLVLGLTGTGCYSNKPVTEVSPEPGTRVAFDINDSGRAALGSTMGPEIMQVEGRLLQQSEGDGILLSVLAVRTARGGEQVWSGEEVRLRPEYLGTKYQRQFSWGKTLFFGAAGLGGLGVFLASRSLLGAGTNDDDGQKPCPSNDCLPGTRIGRLP